MPLPPPPSTRTSQTSAPAIASLASPTAPANPRVAIATSSTATIGYPDALSAIAQDPKTYDHTIGAGAVALTTIKDSGSADYAKSNAVVQAVGIEPVAKRGTEKSPIEEPGTAAGLHPISLTPVSAGCVRAQFSWHSTRVSFQKILNKRYILSYNYLYKLIFLAVSSARKLVSHCLCTENLKPSPSLKLRISVTSTSFP